jgi:hypothetical protein
MSLVNLGCKKGVKGNQRFYRKKVDKATFVKIKTKAFKDGSIKVKVLSRLTKVAPQTACGFIGIASRINADNSKFECMYVRLTNGRAEGQVFRNHAVQNFSFRDFKFPRLRKESPEVSQAYADMALNQWIMPNVFIF